VSYKNPNEDSQTESLKDDSSECSSEFDDDDSDYDPDDEIFLGIYEGHEYYISKMAL
jgi:hypothetical protein